MDGPFPHSSSSLINWIDSFRLIRFVVIPVLIIALSKWVKVDKVWRLHRHLRVQPYSVRLGGRRHSMRAILNTVPSSYIYYQMPRQTCPFAHECQGQHDLASSKSDKLNLFTVCAMRCESKRVRGPEAATNMIECAWWHSGAHTHNGHLSPLLALFNSHFNY